MKGRHFFDIAVVIDVIPTLPWSQCANATHLVDGSAVPETVVPMVAHDFEVGLRPSNQITKNYEVGGKVGAPTTAPIRII